MKTLALFLSIVILSEQAYSQHLRRHTVSSEPRVKSLQAQSLEVQSLSSDNTVANTSQNIVEVDGFSLQQYIMRGRGPAYRGTKITITKDQVLSIKVDFSRSDYSWLFAASGNAAFMYQTHIYKVTSPEQTSPLGTGELDLFRTRVIDAYANFGRGSPEARAALASLVRRNYLGERYSVFVSNEKGALRNDASCIFGGYRTDFNFQQRAPRTTHPGDCADVRQNKVWYINITLNHCDYIASFVNARGMPVEEQRSDVGLCQAEFSLYQDLLYFN